MPRADYQTSTFSYLGALVRAPVDVVRTPRGAPSQSRWVRGGYDYIVPMNDTVRAKLMYDGWIEWVEPDEDMMTRYVRGPKVRITPLGRARYEALLGAIQRQHGSIA